MIRNQTTPEQRQNFHRSQEWYSVIPIIYNFLIITKTISLQDFYVYVRNHNHQIIFSSVTFWTDKMEEEKFSGVRKNDENRCIQNLFYVKLTPITLYNRLHLFVDQLGESSACNFYRFSINVFQTPKQFYRQRTKLFLFL